MKKYLFIALAALGFAACAEKLDDNNAPHGGEMEESYIAINLLSADVETRILGAEDSYEMGTPAERAVKSAYFFFFDENGNPFNVTGAPATAPDATQTGKNHLSLTISEATTSGMPNVSDIKEAVLVLSTYKGVYPKQIVAVLNWTPEDREYSLDELHNAVPANSIGNNTDGYVMSNSVYMDSSNKIVDATPITADNIKTTVQEAMNSPINIYVERTAAKVVLTANGKVADTDNIFKVTEDDGLVPVGGSGITVYMQLLGWELYNDYSTSNLLKNIDITWKPEDLGLTWNDSPYYRSYWAKSQGTDPNDDFSWKYDEGNQKAKGFPTSYGFKVASAVNYDDLSTYTYCGENTNAAELRTKVILKGQLKQMNGSTYEPLEIASWYGNKYAGEENLKIAVANSLKYTLYYYDTDGSKYVSIRPGDLQCVAGSIVGAEAYEIGFQLTSEAAKKTWFQYSSDAGHVTFGDTVTGENTEKANEYLARVEPALLYGDGQTYYYVDIEHLGADGKAAEFGVVRNHVYQIDINSIKGYGSPIYTNMDFVVDFPEYPLDDDEATYVAAKINVLSWKIVKQGVDIVQ